MAWGAYIHIPFCRQKCFYCDFPSFAGRERHMESYVHALCGEIALQGVRLQGEGYGSPSTIYIGGGTPTALPRELLADVLGAARKYLLSASHGPVPTDDGQSLPYSGEHAVEFTIEANPGTVDEAYLYLLHANGINRLSFGVQSFQDHLLRRIGRIHTGVQAKEAIAMARRVGFQNISLDLMYGLPGQTMEDLRASVETALSLAPQHISIYGLQLEEGTVFARQQEMGRLELPSEDVAEEMYDYMTEILPKNGYDRYEISNFARPGFESRHNLGYWQDVPYLGFGMVAHSYWEGRRIANRLDLDGYIQAVSAGESPAHEEEKMTREIAMEEFCFLALRTARGIETAQFFRKFGCTLQHVYGGVLTDLMEKDMLEERDGFFRLTRLGMKYGNLAFEKFLLT